MEVKVGTEVYFTDPSGQLTIPISAAGNMLEIYKVEYEKKTVSAAELSRTELNRIYLIPGQPSDDTVVIEGKRRKGVSAKKVSIEEAKSVAPGGDPAQVTKLLPGVQAQTFRNQISIRGSKSSSNRFLADGINVPFLYHSIGGFSILPEKAIDSIDFSTGGFGAEYGEALGGVISIKTKREVPDRPLTQVKVNLPLYSGIYHERKIDDDSFVSASFRKSYLDYILPKVLKEENLVIPGFWDSHVRYLTKKDWGYVNVLALASLDELKLSVQGGGNEDGKTEFNIGTYFGALGADFSYRINKKWKLTGVPQTVFTRVTNQFTDSYVRIRGFSYRLPLTLERRMPGREKLFLGFEGTIAPKIQIRILAPNVVQDDPFTDFEEAPQIFRETDYRSYSYAAWSAYDFRFQKWRITPGLRYTVNKKPEGSTKDEINKTLDPRINVKYEQSKELLFKAALGKYSKLTFAAANRHGLW